MRAVASPSSCRMCDASAAAATVRTSTAISSPSMRTATAGEPGWSSSVAVISSAISETAARRASRTAGTAAVVSASAISRVRSSPSAATAARCSCTRERWGSSCMMRARRLVVDDDRAGGVLTEDRRRAVARLPRPPRTSGRSPRRIRGLPNRPRRRPYPMLVRSAPRTHRRPRRDNRAVAGERADASGYVGRTAWARNLAAPVRDYLSTETGGATGAARRRRSPRCCGPTRRGLTPTSRCGRRSSRSRSAAAGSQPTCVTGSTRA